LELILVLVLIVLAAAIVWPSLQGAFAHYHVERAGDDLAARVLRTRLAAMERGVPYAMAYLPDSDQFWTWACEPVGDSFDASVNLLGPAETAAAAADAYDRRYFSLNHQADNREFRFLSAAADELIGTMSLDAAARSGLTETTSGERVAASSMLSRSRQRLAVASTRSLAARQIPGLDLTGAADPVVFEPDGTADKDAAIRVAGRDNLYVEITVHSTTGAVTTSSARPIAELPGATLTPSALPPSTGMASRSREIAVPAGGSP
jgi:hypothetical protein